MDPEAYSDDVTDDEVEEPKNLPSDTVDSTLR